MATFLINKTKPAIFLIAGLYKNMQPTLQQRRLYFLTKKFKQAQQKYNLIEENDKIGIGLSGGKDSITLVLLLQYYQRITPLHFEFFPVHVQWEHEPNTAEKRNMLSQFFDRVGIQVHYIMASQGKPKEAQTEQIVPTRLNLKESNILMPHAPVQEEKLPSHEKEKTPSHEEEKPPSRVISPCFFCAWQRRHHLFQYCFDQGWNKLALAHHLDDVAETSLMNLFFHAKLETMQPRTQFFQGKMELIRPLVLTPEKEIRQFAKTLDFPFYGCVCEHVHSERDHAEEILRSFGPLATQIKHNIWRASLKWMENIQR